MPTSAQFKELKKRINELRRHMLPRIFSATGDYSERELDRARGFRVLAHAEIESYIEKIAEDLVDKKISEWKSTRTPSEVLVSFIAAYHRGWTIDENGQPTFGLKAGVKPCDSVIAAIDAANKEFKSNIIQKNNGIKIANLNKIFIPAGVDFTLVDNTWLAQVNSFGRKRGEVAHASKKASKLPDPKDELQTVIDVIDGLADLDEMILDLHSK